ncbi:MAG: amidohydrolase family protein, partial [Gemmatimonadales bacterium]
TNAVWRRWRYVVWDDAIEVRHGVVRHVATFVPFHRLQKIDVERALRAYTASAAWASFTDELTGTLSPGRLADIVVLSGNPFEVEPERLRDLEVDLTIVGGREVYSRR